MLFIGYAVQVVLVPVILGGAGDLFAQEGKANSAKCETFDLRKSPRYRVARRTKTVDGKSIIHISIGEGRFGSDDLVTLACVLNKDFRKDGNVLVLIFDNYESARRYVSRWAQEKPKTWQKDERSQRASYIRDSTLKMHSVAWYSDALNKQGETRVHICP